MSSKSPVYLTYAIESDPPPLCKHRKVPQNTQTFYCQEKPIRLEDQTHLRKLSEISYNFEEKSFKINNFYNNKKDLQTSIFALETQQNFKALTNQQRYPPKAFNVFNKVRESYRKSKQLWLKAKAFEPQESFTWIMKPLKQIQISDMELAKKLKESALKQDIYKRIKAKGFKSSRVIKREQNKAFCEKANESAMIFLSSKKLKDSESSLINKWQNNMFLKQTSSNIKKELLVEDKMDLKTTKSSINKSFLVKTFSKHQYAIKSFQNSKSSFRTTKNNCTNQVSTNIKEHTKNFLNPDKSSESSEKLKSLNITKRSPLGKKPKKEQNKNFLSTKTKRRHKLLVKKSKREANTKSSLESESIERSKSSKEKTFVSNRKTKKRKQKYLKTKENINNFQRKYKSFNENKSSEESESFLDHNKTKERSLKSFKTEVKLNYCVECNKSLLKAESSEKSNENCRENEKNCENLKSTIAQAKSFQPMNSSLESKSSFTSKKKTKTENFENSKNKSFHVNKSLITSKSSLEAKKNGSKSEYQRNLKKNAKSFLLENKSLQDNKSLEVSGTSKGQMQDVKQEEGLSEHNLHKNRNKLKEKSSSKEAVDKSVSLVEFKSFSEAKIHLQNQTKAIDKKMKSGLETKSSGTEVKAKQESLKEIESFKCEKENLNSKEHFKETKHYENQERSEIKSRMLRKPLNFQNPLPQTNSVLIHYIKNITKPKAFKSLLNKKTNIKEKAVESKSSEKLENSKETPNKTQENFKALTTNKDKKPQNHLKQRSKLFLVEPIVQKYPHKMRPNKYPHEFYKETGKAFKTQPRALTKDAKFNLTNDFIPQDSKMLPETEKIVKFYPAKDVTKEKILNKMNSRKECTSSCYSKTLELLTNLGKPKTKPKILFNKLHLEFAKDPLKVLENVGLQVRNGKSKKTRSLKENKKNI